MKSDIKAKWVEALRSGNYGQTTGVLHRTNGGFCCLGVLADICGVEWKESSDHITYHLIVDECLDNPAYEMLPHDWAYNELYLSWETQEELSHMNDGGFDFIEIADWIEENL